MIFFSTWLTYDIQTMCTSSEVLPTPEDALPELPIDEFTASALGLTDVIEKCIANGTKINRANIEGWSMLQYASFIGHTDVVHFLLEKGADPNKTHKSTCPALMLAARFSFLFQSIIIFVFYVKALL